MRALSASLLLLLAALPAPAGELIRYRTPNGSIGFADDEKRLPAGVEVLSRTPMDPPRPPAPAAAPEPAPAPEGAPSAAPAAAAALAAPPATEPAAAPAEAGCEGIADPLGRLRCRGARERRCLHHGLARSCTPDEITTAEAWCARGAELRRELAGIDGDEEAARERLDACQRRGLRPSCDREELDEAERAVRAGERRVEALEEQCHAEGCLPGWVREGCELEPGT